METRTPSAAGKLYARILCWGVVFGMVLGFGWFKSTQNREDRLRQAAWREEIARRKISAQKEYESLRTWFRTLGAKDDGRSQVMARMKDATEVYRNERPGLRDRYQWLTTKHGIEVSAGFRGNRLVSHGLSFSTVGVIKALPRPPTVAFTHWSESVRRWIENYLGFLWLALAPVVMFIRPLRLAAAELMVMLALICGAAMAVAPHYSMTIKGVLSNDALFYALVMYILSVAALGWAMAANPRPIEMDLRPQFRLRTFLVATCLIGVLLGMGPFGIFAIAVLACGAPLLAIVYFVNKKQRPRPVHAIDA